MWIKICANTNLEDAKLAVELGADALGFIFANSPRQVDTAHVAMVTAYLPRNVERIGVFQEHDIEQIENAVKEADLTGVQLHGDYQAATIQRLRDGFGDGLRIIQSAHWKHFQKKGEQVAELSRQLAFITDPEIDSVLIDSRTASATGGTGITFDWNAARDLLAMLHGTELIVAGGLNAANAGEAIKVLQPFGVDVASGVESAKDKRRKDPEKLRAFIAAARAV